MVSSSYDPIAGWYDQKVRSDPLYEEMVLPSMLGLAGDVNGLRVCDIACGQGLVARAFARQGAQVVGVDISTELLNMARRYEEQEPFNIQYQEDAAELLATLDDGMFDGATCGMALMNFADLPACTGAVRRVLKPEGWFVATITHPCFQTREAVWIQRDDGRQAREVSGYFDEGYWQSENPGSVRALIGEHHRTLSTYVNAFADAGFVLEQIHEPVAAGERAIQVPGNLEVPSILTLRFRRL